MAARYTKYKDNQMDLKRRLQGQVPHLLELELREYTNEEIQRLPDVLVSSAVDHGDPITVIYIKIKTDFERLYDDGIARKYLEYRYYIFQDGHADGFIPTAYKKPIMDWLSSL